LHEKKANFTGRFESAGSAVWKRPAHARLDRVAAPSAGGDRLARHDAPEVAVARHLEPQRPGAGDVVEERQQRDAAGGRVAGEDALGEAPAA
jgi:hypothetical protein